MKPQDGGDASRGRSEKTQHMCGWVVRMKKKSQSFPTISSDVCASVMEMQIKLSERVMTDEITDAARRNRLLHVEDSNHLRNTQGGNIKAALRFLPFMGLLKCKINMGHFQVWPNITAVI